jgi:hypothetical protein
MKTIIINSNNSYERDLINNNPTYKSSFESLYFQWIEDIIKTKTKMRITLPDLIETHKPTLENIDGKFYSNSPIKYSSQNIFDLHNGQNQRFSLLINDEENIKAMAICSTWPDCYYISHVRSNIKGGCTQVINKLVQSYWDQDRQKFISFNSIENPIIKLHVLIDNIPAKKCYSKFGFIEIDDETILTNRNLDGHCTMILTNELYILYLRSSDSSTFFGGYSENYKQKYLKYKHKYISLKNNI